MIKKIIPTPLKKKIKENLFNRFSYSKVTRPYIIKLQKKGVLENKVALVTGGSGALGRAICCRLAAEGAKVYVCGMTESKINGVVKEITELDRVAYGAKLDVTDENHIQETFKRIIDKHGKIDILVTSAGGSAREKSNHIPDQDVSVIDDVLNINLRGTMLCAREASKQMIKQRSGKIIALSSTIGVGGKAGFSEYAAAKGGVILFVKSLAMELGKYGVNVNCVTPGIVQRDKIYQQQLERIKQTNYLNSYCMPEDISNMVNFLASEEANFITGQNYIVDGGRSLGLKGD